MTVAAETGLRRSRRSTTAKNPKSSQYVSDISDIDADDSERENRSNDEIDEIDSDSDEEYGKTPSAQRKRKTQTPKASLLKRKKQQRTKLPTTLDEVEDFVENTYFQALSDPEISIVELATTFLEEYEESASKGIQGFVNFVLRCSGCVLQVQEHDVANGESAPETIAEVQQVFAEQQFHEYPLMTTNSKWKSFKSNVLLFVSETLIAANEKGILCTEESTLMENLLTWLSPLSTSALRPLRYVSTYILLLMESVLCEILVKSSGSLEKFQHQLELENNKLQDLKTKLSNAKAARDKTKAQKDVARVERRLEQITSSVESAKREKLVLEEFLNDISNTTFVHRYRDVDARIRQECMAALGHWIEIYPEHFFETTYLRYFGWILSDGDAAVRLEVVKSLLKLYRKAIIVPGFRQFTERFKSRLIEMAIYDSDYSIRVTTLSCLLEVFKIGFLDEEEIMKITGLTFCDINSRANFICSTQNKYLKTHHELAKLIAVIEHDRTKEDTEKYKSALSENAERFTFDINQMLKFKNLLETVENSYNYFSENYSKLERTETLDANVKFVNVFKMLYTLPNYSANQVIEFLLKYLTYDFSSVEQVDEELHKKLELTNSQKLILFCQIGAIASLYLLDDSNSYYQNLIRLRLGAFKKKEVAETSLLTEKDFITNELINSLPRLLSLFKNDKDPLRTYIAIVDMMRLEARKTQNANNLEVVHQVSERLVSIFKEVDIGSDDTQLSESFQDFFQTLLSDHKELSEQNSRILISSLAAEICAEVSHDLKVETNVALLSSLNRLIVLGSCFDITSDLELVSSEYPESVLSVLCEKVQSLEKPQKTDYDTILKILSIYTTWKLESLIDDRQQLLLSDNFKISNYLSPLEDIFKTVKLVVDATLKDEEQKFETQLYFMDFVISLKGFYFKLNEKLKNLENDDKIADLDEFFNLAIDLKLAGELKDNLVRSFLELEYNYSKYLDIELDRLEDEDVAFGANDDQKNDIETEEKVKQKIEAENKLCLFVFKLISLIKFEALPKSLLKRLNLNRESLNSKLYDQLLVTKEVNEEGLTQKEARQDSDQASGQVPQETATATSDVEMELEL